MSKYRYAAYGSNLHPVRLSRRTPSARLLGTEFVDAWELRFNKKSDIDGSAKCNIANGGDGLYVAVYEIDLSEKTMLDGIEGLGDGYQETTICVPGFGDCWIYLAEDHAIDESLQPVDWYKEMVVLGCRYHGFSVEYLRQIAAVQANSDHDEDRRREEWELVGILRNGT